MASTITETHLTQSGAEPGARPASPAVLAILFAISFSHLLNDTIQSLIPAIYPLLKASFQLSFVQIGLITLAFQMTASILQPFVGLYTDATETVFVAWGWACRGWLALRTPALRDGGGRRDRRDGFSIFTGISRVAILPRAGGMVRHRFPGGGKAGSSLGPLSPP